MKNIFICTILVTVMLLSHNSHAQVGFSLGPKGGATFTSFHGDDALDVNRRSGWTAGIYTHVSLLEFIAIQPEFLIHQKGATSYQSSSKNEIRLNYFTVPVLLKLRVPIAETFYPNVFAGPNFSYRLSGTYTSTDTENGEKREVNIDEVRRSDTGGIIGAGIDLEGRNVLFTLDARFGFGFNDLGDDTYYLNLRNNDITIMAGIGFRVGSPKIK